jgi:hypothetical protein
MTNEKPAMCKEIFRREIEKEVFMACPNKACYYKLRVCGHVCLSQSISDAWGIGELNFNLTETLIRL